MSIWFVTGSSRGYGRELVLAALAAGHRVVATARNVDDLVDLVERGGDAVLPVSLDVTDPGAAVAALAAGTSHFGRVDVVVNNAGYAVVAPIETGADTDFRAQFETNFWGVYNVSRAAVAPLRAQGGGTIVQFSSIGGRVGKSPGIASYQAAKFAVDGFSRSLAAETAPFGIRVLVVEPSGFATDWAGSSMTVHDAGPLYEQTVGAWNERRGGAALMAGDPARAARIVVEVAGSADLPSHLLLGANAVDMAIAQSEGQLREAQEWAEVGRSADFDQPFPVTLPDGAS